MLAVLDKSALSDQSVAYPAVSVIVPTCNRPDDLRRCLGSLAQVDYPSWDLLVVDQSDDGYTKALADDYSHVLPGLHYRRLHVKGVSRARNAGITSTTGDILAFLDDDCTVEADWLAQAVNVFSRHPNAAQVFGAMRPAGGLAEWSANGWTPSRWIAEESETVVVGNVRNRLRLPRLLGNGACMFVRRDTYAHAGVFDVHLGPGGRFPSSEDGDFSYRTLMAGYSVVSSPAIIVEHHGLRDYASGAAARLLRAYDYGTGAWMMKLLRLGDPFAVVWIVREIWRGLRYIRPLGFLPGHGPSGLVHLAAFSRGLVGSFQLGVDRRQGFYTAWSTRGARRSAPRNLKPPV